MAKIKLSKNEFKGICEFSREDLLGYACTMYNQYSPAGHHKLIADALERIERGDLTRLIIAMPPRHGKQVVDSTKILTTTGWRRHGDLVVGDYVYHPSGVPTKVVAVSGKSVGTVEVEFTNGQIIKCHENHEWVLYDGASGKSVTVETKELFSRSLHVGPENKRGERYVLQLPPISALDKDNVNLPIHPYTLGVWLGDGSGSCGTYSCSAYDSLNDYLIEVGEKISKPWVHKDTKVLSQTIYGLLPNIRSLNLRNNKHIPDVYFTGSKQQRLDLLAGLVDTDGSIDEKTGRVRIVSCSKLLTEDIAKLVSTFGWRATITEQEPTLSSSGVQGNKEVYTVAFNNDEKIPVRLYHKWKNQRGSYKKRAIAVKSVKYTDTPETGHCIQVDSEDGLYLVGEYLVTTHNSMLCSEFFPSWYLGRNPGKQVIITSATGELAQDFGGKIRNLMQDEMYQHIFSGVTLRKDSKAKNRFHTNRGGILIAAGMGGQIVGRGANLLIIDDPIKSWKEADSETVRKDHKSWYSGTAYHRLMPGDSAICVIQTRWHTDDLAGHLLSEHTHENWTVLELPAISEETGAPLWPEAFDLAALTRIKQTLTKREWLALYMQKPSDDEGNILKRSDWQMWPKNKPFPKSEFIIQSYDTAFSDKDQDTASRSARTTWGLFKMPDGNRGLLLLEAWAERVDYPNLKYNFLKAYKDWKPDKVIIEKRASGQSLIQDLRKSGIPVSTYNPDRDKIARAYAVQALLEAKLIYYPDRRWADDVIDEMSKFPVGKTDDYVDTATQAWLFLRNSGMLELEVDWSAWSKDVKDIVDPEKEEDDSWVGGKVTFINRQRRKKPAYG